MKAITKVLVMGCVAVLALATAPALYAQSAPCAVPHPPLNVGNLTTAASEGWNSLDPNASFTYFFLADPSINQGSLTAQRLVADGIFVHASLAGLSTNETMALGPINIALNSTLGTQGCPDDVADKTAVFTFSDCDGSVVVIVGDGGAGSWNWDTASGAGTVPSQLVPLASGGVNSGFIMTKEGPAGSPFTVAVTDAASDGAGGFNVGLSWTDSSAWMGEAVPGLTVCDYSVMSQQVPIDADLCATPSEGTPVAMGLQGNSAMVNIPETDGTDTYLSVIANLCDSSGAPTSGQGVASAASTRLSTDPTIARPDPRSKALEKGRGKGLQKDHPGNN